MDWWNNILGVANRLTQNLTTGARRIGGALSGGPAPSAGKSFLLRVQCNRCGEILEVRLNIYNESSAEFDESGATIGYTCRKLLQGSGRCFQQMEVRLTFDARRRLTDSVVVGGRLLPETQE
jgi:hypothetical protein